MWNDLCIQMNKLAPPQHSMKTWKKIWLRYVQTRLLRLDTQKMIAPNPANEENQTEKENASTETKSNQSNTSDSSVGSRTYDTDSGITSSHITNESVDINKQAIESDENRMKDQNLDQQVAVQIQNTDLGVVSSHIANKAAEINENCMKNHQDQGLQSDIGAQTNNTDLIMAPSPIPNESESCINSELQGDRDEVTSTIVIDDDDDVIVERNRTDFTTKAPKASADHLTKSENQSENDYFTSLIEVLGEANTIAEEELKVIRTLEQNQEKYRKEKLEIFEKEVLAIEAKVESLEKKQAKVIILKNPMHRIEEAHPGDTDYRRPLYPDPPLGTPDCPYGNLCYRRNPVHFQQFAHPPSTDFEKNYRNRKRMLRQRKKKAKDPEYDDDFIDDEELEQEDFSSDEDDEYVPSDTDDEDTEEMV
ncbi:unnamed protein product [Hermetia illucens]|uniref:PBZ-type domain-containing protein n=1 Tax=Hermetia illucens TaxID=343691 RepID=A0A7R8USC9_HERIL|nr:unnamed protein product [Hermetia illucens]